MSEADEHEDEISGASQQGEGPESADASGEPRATDQAKDELVEAASHFMSAASILFERAKSDPRFTDLGREAGRILSQLGGAAEPTARQVGDELSRFTKKMAGVVETAVDAFEGAVDSGEADDGSDDEG